MTSKILGQSLAVKNLLQMIDRVASSKTNILIIGESGTGKELVARMIHESGALCEQPFVPINCGAIPENLMESELFGHVRGSFTGAVQDKEGLFELANHGTLFLDEVGEIPLSLQVKLLRVLQERSFRKVGGVEDIKVEVRIIAATNRDLESMVTRGEFREDLYYRLNVILIRTPPLREREEDIRILAIEFLKKFSSKAGKNIEGFDPEAMEALLAYHWPGNVRELENCIERAITLESESMIQLDSLPSWAKLRGKKGLASGEFHNKSLLNGDDNLHSIHLPPPNFSHGRIKVDQILENVERIYITAALKEAGGLKKKAAELVGMSFRSFRYRLSKLGISDDET